MVKYSCHNNYLCSPVHPDEPLKILFQPKWSWECVPGVWSFRTFLILCKYLSSCPRQRKTDALCFKGCKKWFEGSVWCNKLFEGSAWCGYTKQRPKPDLVLAFNMNFFPEKWRTESEKLCQSCLCSQSPAEAVNNPNPVGFLREALGTGMVSDDPAR